MRAFVSADMEGATGIAAPEDVVKGEAGYDAGAKLMVGDVNAAVEGAVAAGADEVIVNDSHGPMTNLSRDALHDAATLVRGASKPRSMMQGLTPGTDVALFVGYHAMAGTEAAVLNHSYLGHELIRIRINGEEAGEMGCNARLSGALGVPVGLVTGDDAAVAEAEAELGGVETATVKEAIDRFSAVCEPAPKTRPRIRDAAKRAVERAVTGDLPILDPETPAIVEVEWAATNHAARATHTGLAERVGPRTTRVEAPDYPAAYDGLVRTYREGAAGRDEFYG